MGGGLHPHEPSRSTTTAPVDDRPSQIESYGKDLRVLQGRDKYLVGIGASLILVALFLFTGNPSGMLAALGSANYWYVIPAVVMYFVSVYFRAMRWSVLLRHIRPVKVPRLFPVVVVGYMANNLLFVRLGELVRCYYLSEREGVSTTSALVTVFVERIFDALTRCWSGMPQILAVRIAHRTFPWYGLSLLLISSNLRPRATHHRFPHCPVDAATGSRPAVGPGGPTKSPMRLTAFFKLCARAVMYPWQSTFLSPRSLPLAQPERS